MCIMVAKHITEFDDEPLPRLWRALARYYVVLHHLRGLPAPTPEAATHAHFRRGQPNDSVDIG
jgi:hypothetical protein